MESPYDLVQRMRDLGADDPEGWAHSEAEENIAQEARWLVLRSLLQQCVNGWNDSTLTRVPAAQRAVDAGAAPKDVALAMRAAAYEAVFGVLSLIDDGFDSGAPDDAPGWMLREVRYDAEGDVVLTGRAVGGLHEDIRAADPSGQVGSDLSR
jgi:hypothetical protein